MKMKKKVSVEEKKKVKSVKKKKKKVIVSEDIIEYGILPRLPAKALIRFQGVSKRWRALISTDVRFLRLQSDHARSSPALLLFFGETSKPVFLSHAEEKRKSPSSIGFPDICSQLRFGGPQPDWIPLAACGEFLCAAITSPLNGGHRITKLYLGNPVWGRWTPLPAPPNRAPRNSACTMGLAVYETGSRHAYKLFMPVCMIIGQGRFQVSFWVLSSSVLFWQRSGPVVLLNSWTDGFEFQSNVCVEGIYFWRAVGEVLWLDPKEARGGTIPLPDADADADADDEFWILGEWDGRLSFMILIDDLRIHLWSWDQSSSSWSFRILITIADIAQGNPHLFTSMGLRMNLRNRNAESLDVILARTRSSIFAFGVGFILLKVNFGVLCYDATTGKAWKLNRRLWGCDSSTRPFAYMNSLLQLKIPLLITPWLQY